MLPIAAGLLVVLQTLDGGRIEFPASDAKATVVVFFSTVCPVANDYADRIRDIESTYRGRGVRLLVVYSNRSETADEVRHNASGNEFPFPVYLDPGNALADQLNARVTPTAYVLGVDGSVRYRGAIDDAVNPARVKSYYLRNAIDFVLAGRTPEPAVTDAVG